MKKGFTLIEMLVVVLIIGILAGIALPQYQMAVTKAKVASILPLMRRWKDALAEYKLQHGSYRTENDEWPNADTLGVNWPSDWKCGNKPCGDSLYCGNNYWNECVVLEDDSGYIYCYNSNNNFSIYMYQSDDPNETFRGKITCYADNNEGHKVCKALGGKLAEEGGSEYILY